MIATIVFCSVLAGLFAGFVIGNKNGIAMCQLNHPWEHKK